MEKSYMRPDTLVELEFISNRSTDTHWHENYELMFVVSGSMDFTVEQDVYHLDSRDLLLVNVNRKHSYQGTEKLVLARFVISDRKVRELLGMEHLLFWCNSVSDRNEAYDSLRRVIADILNQAVRETPNKLFLMSLYYQMLHILAENFTLSAKDMGYVKDEDRTDARIEEIFSYIRSNYRQNISLHDIAQHLYLSTTYLSRYIKKKCGMNFLDLMNSVRLSRSMEGLLYTDDSIMKIALENGFASVGAYNKVFRDAYHQTPSEFRRQHRNEREQGSEAEKKHRQLIHQKVEEYLKQNPNKQEEAGPKLRLIAEINMGLPAESIWNRNACRLINAGTAMDILNAAVQRQILDNQENMGFEYVRFWDIYAPELYLNIHSPDGKQNFSRLNAVTDFLVEHHLKPYIELGFKGRRILRSIQQLVMAQARVDFFQDEREMVRFYRSLFRHFIKRYGPQEVSGWYFEYWENPGYSAVNGETLQYAGLAEHQHREYFHQFGVVAKALRDQLPAARIGGAGFPARVYGQNTMAQMLALWKQEEQQPDFLSLNCYPYQQEQENGVYYEKRSSDMHFVRYGLEIARKAMEMADFPQVPVHVAEYGLSLSNRNVLNDSCLKAAYLLYNAIDCLGRTEMMGHYLFSDCYAESTDTGAILFGGSGCFTKDGIAKPSYYALEFLNMLYSSVQKKHDNYLVTINDHESLRLVCHNLKKPNFNYYLSEEDLLQIQDIPSILSDRKFLSLHFRISGLQDGVYMVKVSVLNSRHGSIQDKWMDLNMESNLTRKEMNYLRISSHSDIFIREYECRAGCLELELELEPNEICYMHISRQSR